MTTKQLKVDIHNHILPERWPDLKEVSLYVYSSSSSSCLHVSIITKVLVSVMRLDDWSLCHSLLALWLWRMDTAAPPLQGAGQDDARWASVPSD